MSSTEQMPTSPPQVPPSEVLAEKPGRTVSAVTEFDDADGPIANPQGKGETKGTGTWSHGTKSTDELIKEANT